MAYDSSDPFTKALGYFLPGDTSDPRANPQLRQRIALAMMQREKKFPKNLGEGLASIGDAIAERRLMQQIEQSDIAEQGRAPPAAAPETPPPAALAPPDGGAVAPGVAAINAAAPIAAPTSVAPPGPPPEAQPAPPLETAPAQPPSMLGSQMPTGVQDVTATPLSQAFNPKPMLNQRMVPPPAGGPPAPPQATRSVAPQGPVADDGYNLLDAQAGMGRVGSARGQAAAERIYPGDPDMQAYASQMTAAEQPRPGDTSKTGARGMYQFVPGTARQYGLTNPDDDASSADAFKRFTADNAKIFERINGRPPSMAELAVMHQQGGGTGAKMVAGTGNAPAGNLAVNNVDPGSGPGAAVAKIKAYYGMPDRPVDARDAIAAQLTAQAVPQPNPTTTGAPPPSSTPPTDQRLALAGPQGGPTSDVQPAPPVPSGIRAAPQQVAQAQPDAIPGYVPPMPGPTKGAPVIQMTQRERDLTNWLAAETARGNPYAQAKADAAGLRDLQNQRTIRQNEANEQYKADLARDTEQAKQSVTGRMDQTSRINADATARQEQEKRALEIADAKDKAALQARLGGRAPEQFFTEFDKQKESAAGAASAMDHYALAQEMLKKGVIAGTGQGWKVDAAKVASAFGYKSAGEAVARTEQMEAAIKSTLRLAVENIQGAGGKVSDTDVKVASGTIGADPKQQLETIQRLVNEGQKVARLKINDYEEQKDYYLGGTRAERRYDIPMQPTAPAPHLKTLLDNRDSEAHKQEFDDRFGTGAAALEIARAKRRERRGG